VTGLLVTLAILGCQPIAQCTDNTQCTGEEACIRGKCKPVDCLSSRECDIEQFCDPQAYTCVDGCQYNSDCHPTDRCDPTTLTCVPRQCRDTATDCPGGAFCDTDSGECYPDPDPDCARCSSSDQCGPTGTCYGWDSHGGYCFLTCNPEDAQACPAGYSCSLVNQAAYVCVGYCPLL